MLEEESLVTIYFYAKCSKCRESLCLLEENDERVELVEYMKKALTREQLTALIEQLQITPFDLVRTKEEIFQKKFSKRSKSRFDWIGAMIKYPELMERPIVVKNKRAVIGRPPSKVLDLL